MYVQRVSPEEALELIEKEEWVYVDVRSVYEFDQGHPRGAYNVPLLHMDERGSTANPDFLSVMERRFPKDAHLVVGCRTSNRSEHAVVLLAGAGFTNLRLQGAGFLGTHDSFGREDLGWSRKGLPTSHEAEPGRSWVNLSDKDGE